MLNMLFIITFIILFISDNECPYKKTSTKLPFIQSYIPNNKITTNLLVKPEYKLCKRIWTS